MRTDVLQDKLLTLWGKMERGELSNQEARTHVGFARAILDCKKVEIAAAHLNLPNIPSVTLGSGKPNGRRLTQQ